MLVLIVVWSYVVLSYGGEDQARTTVPEGGETTAQTTTSAVPDEPAYAEGGSTNGSANGSTDSSDGGSSGDDNTEGQALEGAGAGAGETRSVRTASPRGRGARTTAPRTACGASNEPGNYDPLGQGRLGRGSRTHRREAPAFRRRALCLRRLRLLRQ